MKAWELMEQLQGRDPSGQVTVHLEGNDRYAIDLELSPPCQRKIEIDVALPCEELMRLEDQAEVLEGMVDDLQSALQKISFALKEFQSGEGSDIEGLDISDLVGAIEAAKEISMREKP